MGAQASVQTRLAVDAFADEDAAIATALPDMDDVMDDLQKELFRAIFDGFAGPADEAALQMAVQLAFVGRDYERAADHAVMIGRLGVVHGDRRAPRRRRGPRVAVLGHPLFRCGSPCVHADVRSDPPAVLTITRVASEIPAPEDTP